MCWILAKSRGFEVSSYYQALLGVGIQSFPWRSIWKPKVPYRVAFFVWTAVLGTILTIDNLRKRKVVILDWCYMCKSKGESVDQFLLRCPIVFELCSYGVHLVWYIMVLSGWLSLIVWCGAFGRRETTGVLTLADLKLLFFKTLSDWMSIIGRHSIFSVYDLMDACNLCIWLFWSPAVYFLYTWVTPFCNFE